MTTQPATQETRTQHSEMLNNTRVALDKLLADQRAQQESLALIEEQARGQQEKLDGNQARRAELLDALGSAQLAANKAQAGYDLAHGTPSEQEREQLLTEAKRVVFAHMDDIQLVADSDMALREQAEQTRNLLEEAQEAERRINERVSIAQSLYDETLCAHRDEIKKQQIEVLQAARSKRDKLRAQLAKADEAVDQAQLALASSLKQWPEYAVQVLQEYLEVQDDERTQTLQKHLTSCLYAEEHAKSFDPRIAQLMSIAPPVVFFKNYDTRAQQIAHAKATLKSPGRGVSPDLWAYDDAIHELERVVVESRQAHKQRLIEQLVYDHKEQIDQHTGWQEANRTLNRTL